MIGGSTGSFNDLREEGTGEAYFFIFQGYFFIEIYTNIDYN